MKYNFTKEQIESLSDEEQEELLALMEQELLERVSPKLEAFRDPIIGGTCSPKIRIRGCRGGRGAGAKSHSLVSLIVQRANAEIIDVICLREIMGSIDESVKKLIQEKIEFLGYKGWIIKNNSIEGPLINGKRSHFIFKGLKDLRASTNIKGLESYDIAFLEEAATLSKDSLDLLLPTIMRHKGSQIWFAYNPMFEDDNITTKIWDRHRDDALCIELEEGAKDNPWWNEGLEKERIEDYKADPELARHTWAGEMLTQGDAAILSRIDVQDAMERTLPDSTNKDPLIVGADIARYGSDRTVIVVRRGMKVLDITIGKKWDTMYTAKKCLDIGQHDPTTVYNIDGGAMGPGVIDKLRELNCKHVNEINFGANPLNKEKYVNKTSEMWFNLADLIKEIDIPNNRDLKSELCSRQYSYDNRGRKKVEPKDEYKKRKNGVSPDLADALLLCYSGNKGNEVNLDIQEQMRKRRGL